MVKTKQAVGIKPESSVEEATNWATNVAAQMINAERDLLQHILDTVETVIIALDAVGMVTMINSYGTRVLGKSVEDIVGRAWFAEFLPQPDGMQRVYPVFLEIMAGNLARAEYFENEILTAGGERRLIAWHNAYWTDASGTIIGTLSAGHDATEQRATEQALLDSNEDMRRAQAIGQIGSWRLDLLRNVLTWSEETYRLFGVAPGTPLTYQLFLAAVHPDDRHLVNAEWQAALTGAPYDLEHRIIVKGEEKWVRERAELVCAPDGVMVGAYGSVQDITERKLAALSLAESEERLRRAQQAAHIGVYAYEIIEDQWTSSDELDAIFGTGTTYVRTAAGWLALVHPDDRDMMVRHLTDVVEGRRPRFDQEYRIRRANDSVERWLHGVGTVEVGPDGRPLRMIGTILDITERKLAEQARDEAYHRNRRLFESSPLPMWVFDGETLRFLDVNDAAIKEYGYSREEFLGLQLTDLVPADKHPDLRLRTGTTGRPMNGDVVRHLRKDGSMIDVAVWSDNIQYEGKRARLAISQDITLQLKLEAARAQQLALAKQLKQIAETVPGAICAFEQRSDGSYALPYLEGRDASIFDLSPAVLAEDATPLFERIHPDDRPGVLDGIAASAAAMTPWHGLFRIELPEASERWIEVNSLPQAEPGGNVMWNGYLMDATESVAARLALEKARNQSQALAARLELVREEERTRIARELHDELGQTLTAIRMNLRRIGTATQDQALTSQIASIESMVEDTTKAVRRIAHELRPRILDTLDLSGAIEWEAVEFSKHHGIRCQCRVPEVEIDVPELVKSHVYRIFQEAMTNIVRHAHPSRVEIDLTVDNEALRLSVRDNGKGLSNRPLASDTLGIVGMHERANQMGATLTLTTVPQVVGTWVELCLPLSLVKSCK